MSGKHGQKADGGESQWVHVEDLLPTTQGMARPKKTSIYIRLIRTFANSNFRKERNAESTPAKRDESNPIHTIRFGKSFWQTV
jgi:hypothetical protein